MRTLGPDLRSEEVHAFLRGVAHAIRLVSAAPFRYENRLAVTAHSLDADRRDDNFMSGFTATAATSSEGSSSQDLSDNEMLLAFADPC